jgi:gamma-glutamyltranspeptidase
MTIYMANGTKLAMIARETAPAAASKDMYHGDADLTHYGELEGEGGLTVPGPLASGVPGFVAGTWELKKRLGNPAVTWEHLIQPSVDLCFEGITVNNHAYHMMHQARPPPASRPGAGPRDGRPRAQRRVRQPGHRGHLAGGRHLHLPQPWPNTQEVG